MEDNLKSMQVMIAGRSYPLRAKPSDVESIRKVVDELNEKVKDFQLTYINKDKQDCLAMALLTYAVDLHKERQSDPVAEVVSQKVDQIETLIDGILQ